MAAMIKTLSQVVPPGKLKQLESSLGDIAEARARVTKAEVSFMDRLRAAVALGRPAARAVTASTRKTAAKPEAVGKTTKAEKKAVKKAAKVARRNKGKMSAPGAGKFRCLTTDCPYNKKPFGFKMHAVLHAKATKHRIDWGKDKPAKKAA